MCLKFVIEDRFGFEAGDWNKRRYVNNNPMNLADPSGLIDFRFADLEYLQENGGAGYQIRWQAITRDDQRKEHETQLWIITKRETWSVVKEGAGVWGAWPAAAKYDVKYKGDFVDLLFKNGDRSTEWFNPIDIFGNSKT